MFRTLEIVGRGSALALLLVASIVCSPARADEVIIQEGGLGEIECGDYACSPCMSKLGTAIAMRNDFDQNTIEMTAGELWQFFDKQGYRSVNKLSLFLDVERLSSDSSFNLSKLNIQIQSPEGPELLLTDANLGGDGLIVPGYETSSSRPEAQLKFDLGYDFMELFSSDSTELVRVSIESPVSEASAPTFLLTADDNVFGRTNLGNMFFFVLFWGVVFLIVLRWMKPVRVASPARRSNASGGIAIAARRSA